MSWACSLRFSEAPLATALWLNRIAVAEPANRQSARNARSRYSRALLQSRCTVRSDTPRMSAISTNEKPQKNLRSTISASAGSTAALCSRQPRGKRVHVDCEIVHQALPFAHPVAPTIVPPAARLNRGITVRKQGRAKEERRKSEGRDDKRAPSGLPFAAIAARVNIRRIVAF